LKRALPLFRERRSNDRLGEGVSPGREIDHPAAFGHDSVLRSEQAFVPVAAWKIGDDDDCSPPQGFRPRELAGGGGIVGGGSGGTSSPSHAEHGKRPSHAAKNIEQVLHCLK